MTVNQQLAVGGTERKPAYLIAPLVCKTIDERLAGDRQFVPGGFLAVVSGWKYFYLIGTFPYRAVVMILCQVMNFESRHRTLDKSS